MSTVAAPRPGARRKLGTRTRPGPRTATTKKSARPGARSKPRTATRATTQSSSAALLLATTVAVLNLVGVIMVLSASSVASLTDYGSPWYFFLRQLLWSVVGVVAFVVAIRFDYHKLRRFVRPMLILSAVLLVVVIQDRREASAREAGLRDALEASARAPDAQPRVNDPSPATPAPQPSPDVQVAPPPPPAAPPPAPAPSNSIVGKWKLTQVLGSTYLTFMADGHYSIENLLGMTETGLYVFSPDGTLRMQDDSFFSGQTTIWHCSVSGDSLSVLEGDSGAAHLYTRIGG